MIEKFIVFNRRFNDDFFFDTMIEVLQNLESQGINYDSYYLPWPHFSSSCYFHKTNKRILFHMDALHSTEFLTTLVSHNLLHKNVIFSSQLNNQHLQNFKNTLVVHWGSDYLLQEKQYRNLEPVKEKTVIGQPHWICLNHDPKPHRLLISSYLKGLGLDVYGRLHINPEKIYHVSSWHNLCPANWSIETVNETTNKIMNQGFDLLKSSTNNVSEFKLIYPESNNNNVSNFDRNLRRYYAHTLIEIVNETVYDVTGHHLTEKFINSVFGMNIPLLFGVPGVVSYVKSLGFDTFEDVVDTSYDSITDPIQRMITAIDSNIRLLSDPDFAYQIWHSCQHRLINNIDWAKNHMHNCARQKTIDALPRVIEFLTST